MTKYILFLIVICLLIQPFYYVYASSNNVGVEDLFKQAKKDYESLKMTKAEELFMEIINNYPETKYASLSLEVLIELYDETGKLNKLINLFDIAESKRINISTRSALTIALHLIYSEKQYKKAEILLNSIVSTNLEDLEFQEYLDLQITNSIKNENLELANQYIKKYIKKFPEDHAVYFGIGISYFAINKKSEMIYYFEKYSSSVLHKENLYAKEIQNLILIQNIYLNIGRSDLAYQELTTMKGKIFPENESYEAISFLLALAAYYEQNIEEATLLFHSLQQTSTDEQIQKFSREVLDEIKNTNI